MLLQVVALSGNIGIHDLVVRQLDSGDLTDGRVGLTRLLREDSDTDTLLLETGIQSWGTGFLLESLATTTHHLVQGGHGPGLLLLERIVHVHLLEEGRGGSDLGGGGGGPESGAGGSGSCR